MPCLASPSLLVLIACLLAPTAAGENWPGWRGPRGDGTSHETGLPTKWDGTLSDLAAGNIAWKVALPGLGHASPIVWNDRIYTVTCIEESGDRALLCLDRADGSIIWQQTVFSAPLEDKHRLNSFASSTPATDGQQVYVSFLDGQQMLVAAYDLEGRQQWLARPGGFSSKHGYCSSPVLYENLVIINGDHDGDAYIVAVDRSTGETVWKTPRENKTRSYCTPIIRHYGGQPHLILSGSLSVCSYDPRDGSRHWVIDGPTEQFVASIVDNGELLFMTAGFPDHHILAIRPDGKGNVTDTHIAWRTTENCSYVPSPIVVGEYFLIVSDAGVGSCYRAATGERLWRERMGRRYSASLLTADGLVYFVSDDGDTSVVRPGDEYELLAVNPLGDICSASPIAHNGQLLIRGEQYLWCIGRKDRQAGR